MANETVQSWMKELDLQIQQKLNDHIHPESELFTDMKVQSRLCLSPAKVTNCKKPSDILEKLHQVGCTKEGGPYEKLLEILVNAELIQIKCEIEELVQKVSARQSVRDECPLHDPADSTGCQSKSAEQQVYTVFRKVTQSDACKEWRHLGRVLGLQQHTIDALIIDNPGDIKEQCFLMLNKWHQQIGYRDPINLLTSALEEIGYMAVADDIRSSTNPPRGVP